MPEPGAGLHQLCEGEDGLGPVLQQQLQGELARAVRQEARRQQFREQGLQCGEDNEVELHYVTLALLFNIQQHGNNFARGSKQVRNI